jgi:hypothetical protein
LEDLEDIKDSLRSLLSDDEEQDQDHESDENNSRFREEVLSIQDPSEIGPDEYMIFLDYSIANIYKILRTKIKTKIPESSTINDMAKEAIQYHFYCQ